MSPATLQLIEIFALVIGPAGGVYIGVKSALNGLKADNKEQLVLLREMRDDIKILRENSR